MELSALFAAPDLGWLLAGVVGAGLFAGLVGGMFGIGGGVVIVPALIVLFEALGVGEVKTHVAIGTSLATIIVTSARSLWAHARHGEVDFDVLRSWSPFIVLGAILGSAAARFLPGAALTVVFALGVLGVALRLAVTTVNGAAAPPPVRELPTGGLRGALATAIGFVSSLMGIGGGVMGVMALTLYGRNIHNAVATCSGFGIAIGAPGALGFMIAGLGQEGLPPGSIGYVNVLAFAVIAAMTAIVAPFGARLAHMASRTLLSRIFAVYLTATAIKLLWDVYSGGGGA